MYRKFTKTLKIKAVLRPSFKIKRVPSDPLTRNSLSLLGLNILHTNSAKDFLQIVYS